MRPSLIRRVAFVSFRLATRAARYARTGGIRRTHPANDKRPATRLLRPRRADGFHARRPSESPILPDAESSLIQPALRYLHQNLLEGGRCLSAGHLIRIAMRARLSIFARLLAALRPPQACLLAPERRRGWTPPVVRWVPSRTRAAGAVLRVRSAGTPTCGDRRGRPGLIPNAAAFGAAVSRRRVTRRPPVVTRALRWS
ncbi:hypothetical protein FB107DRAFT_255205 [Schizophyllum commune]